MTILTDTDFLPDERYIERDAYLLLYGTLILGYEDYIYGAIMHLCKKQEHPILMRAKVSTWLDMVNDVVDKLDRNITDRGDDVEVFIPYMMLRCNAAKVMRQYKFARTLLKQMLDMWDNVEIPNISIENGDKYLLNIYANVRSLMRRNLDKMKKYYTSDVINETLDKDISLENILDDELIRRGYVGGLFYSIADNGMVIFDGANRKGITAKDVENRLKEKKVKDILYGETHDCNENDYRQLFFTNRRVLDLIPQEITNQEQPNDDKKENDEKDKVLKVSICTIYNGLEHLCKSLVGKDYDAKLYAPLIMRSTFRLANSVIDPEYKVPSNKQSANTFYKYANGVKEYYHGGKSYEIANDHIKEANGRLSNHDFINVVDRALKEIEGKKENSTH